MRIKLDLLVCKLAFGTFLVSQKIAIEEKSVMFKQYYNKLVSKYYCKSGKLFFQSGV